MPGFHADFFATMPVFVLVLFRLSGLVMVAPVLSSRMIPLRVRAALLMTMGIAIFPTVLSLSSPSLSVGEALAGGAGEIMLGMAIGLSFTVILMAAEVAGELVGQQAGFSFGEIVDPTFGSQTTIMNQVYSIVFVVAFLVVGGHRAMIAALLDTYEAIPLLGFRPGDSLILLFVEVVTAGFMLGVRLGGPVLIALFLSGIALALLSRTMPQLNILTVGFTLRVLIALATAGLALGVCEGAIADAVDDTLESVRVALGVVNGRGSGTM